MQNFFFELHLNGIFLKTQHTLLQTKSISNNVTVRISKAVSYVSLLYKS